MIKKITIALLILIACLTAGQSFSQLQKIKTKPDQYRAVNWGLNDGLSQACVYQMRQDVNGFLWMGTQGELSRFDGSVFKNYYHDPKKSGTINAKYTAFGLVEDSLHNIWTGTNNGLHRYDIKADTFTRLLSAAPLCATSNELFCAELPGSIILELLDVQRRQFSYVDPPSGRWVTLDLTSVPYLTLWSDGGPFLCVEPCWGLTDHHQQRAFENKEGIQTIAPGGVLRASFSMASELASSD